MPEHTSKDTVGPVRNPSLDTDPMAPAIEDRLDEIRSLLERMLALAEISADDGTADPERQALQQELERLRRPDQARIENILTDCEKLGCHIVTPEDRE